MRIALIGDYNPLVKAHQAIPRALALSADTRGINGTWEWIHTATLQGPVSEQLGGFDGVWCVPASPYTNAGGAIAAIRFAREHHRPFLGTCGGFQHAMLEIAESLWGVSQPAHAETEPDAIDPVIAPLVCSLVEQTDEIHLEPGSRLAEIYGVLRTREAFHCRYGLSAAYRDRLRTGPLRISGRDSDGDVRAVELDGHPFFVATLFQPERATLEGRAHPIVDAFVDAAVAASLGASL